MLNPEDLLSRLQQWPPARAYLVGYSGGLDSSVLLALAAEVRGALPGKLHAIHVDHGLQSESGDWARRSVEQCDALGVPCHVVRIDTRDMRQHSPEARARVLRYEALGRFIEDGDMLLTAHHLDDQAETVVLQMLRGAGPAGLAAMPPLQPFGAGWHGRPLLHARRAELAAYAQGAGLAWIEDGSNLDTHFDRNFIRHEVMPLLSSRWPSAATVLARVAVHQGRAAAILGEVGNQDLQRCMDDAAGCLRLDALSQLSRPRQDNLLRAWFSHRGLGLPSTAQLACLHDEVIGARADAQPCQRWPGVEVHRYRGGLYAFPPLPERDPRQEIPWNPAAECRLRHGTLTAHRSTGSGLRCALLQGGMLQVRFRSGGERLRTAAVRHERQLKKLWQEASIPPWLRSRIPLIYHDARLAAVPGYWVSADVAASGDEPGLSFEWCDKTD